MSYVEMAAKAGVTEGTVRRKMHRLTEEGIVRVVAVANPFALGYGSPAIISISAMPGLILEVAEQLEKLPGVRFVALTTGTADLIVEGYWENNVELTRFLTEEMARVKGIRDFSTSLVLRILKQSYEMGAPGKSISEVVSD